MTNLFKPAVKCSTARVLSLSLISLMIKKTGADDSLIEHKQGFMSLTLNMSCYLNDPPHCIILVWKPATVIFNEDMAAVPGGYDWQRGML